MAKVTRRLTLEQFLQDARGCLENIARQGEPIVVEVAGKALMFRRLGGPEILTPEDMEEHRKNWDPERFAAMLESTRGALKGLDREEFLREMHEARGQDSIGRPAD